VQRKKKEAKKKEGEACGNCRSRGNRKRWPSASFFLMISTAAWKSLRKKRSGFPTVTTGPAATCHLLFGNTFAELDAHN